MRRGWRGIFVLWMRVGDEIRMLVEGMSRGPGGFLEDKKVGGGERV